MEDRDFDRLRWRCRRGLLELDLILPAFLERQWPWLDAGQRERFEELLESPDNDLLDWVLGREEPADPRFAGVVRLLRTDYC